MEIFKFLLDFFLNLETHLDTIIQTYQNGTYVILFLIIFAETGLIVTPFLPGDSLLFAVGAFIARGSLDLGSTLVLLIIAAILGDTVNYSVGNFIGEKILEKEKIPLIKKNISKKRTGFMRFMVERRSLSPDLYRLYALLLLLWPELEP